MLDSDSQCASLEDGAKLKFGKYTRLVGNRGLGLLGKVEPCTHFLFLHSGFYNGWRPIIYLFFVSSEIFHIKSLCVYVSLCPLIFIL